MRAGPCGLHCTRAVGACPGYHGVGGLECPRPTSTVTKRVRSLGAEGLSDHSHRRWTDREIEVNNSEGAFRAVFERYGHNQRTVKEALDNLCIRMLDRAKKKPKEVLCDGLDEFYEKLPGRA